MQFIFSTGSLYTYGIDRCFALAEAAGFDGIELMVDQRWDTRQPEYLRKLSAQHGQPIRAVHSPFGAVPGWPKDEVDRIAESVKLAEAVEAQVVVHHLPFRGDWVWVRVGDRRWPLPLPWERQHQAYRRWLLGGYFALQSQTKVRLCIENMPARQALGRRWNVCQWNSVAEMARFPTLTLDTTHLGTWGLEPSAVYAQLKRRVRHIHLSNFDGREHRLPEKGHLALDRLLAQMARDGYEGVITLELHPDAVGAGEPEAQIVARLRESLRCCREWAGSGLGG